MKYTSQMLKACKENREAGMGDFYIILRYMRMIRITHVCQAVSVIGLFIILLGYLFQDHMQSCYVKVKRFNRLGTFLRFMIRNAYFYIVTMAYIFQWRAIWNLFVFYISDDLNLKFNLTFQL